MSAILAALTSSRVFWRCEGPALAHSRVLLLLILAKVGLEGDLILTCTGEVTRERGVSEDEDKSRADSEDDKDEWRAFS